MTLLRSSVYFVLMLLSVGVYGLIVAVGSRFNDQAFADRWSSRWGRTNLWLQARVCGLHCHVTGLENLPEKPCIILSKHQSAWETIALRGILPPAQSWVLKKELMGLPLFGQSLRAVKSIAIDRSAGRRAVIKVVKDGTARLAEGRWVIIFPEGTRTAPGQRQKYGMGGGLLAERSGAMIVPIAHNAGVFWRRRGVKKYPGTIDVIVGSPIDPANRKAAEIMTDVESWIENQQEKLPIER